MLCPAPSLLGGEWRYEMPRKRRARKWVNEQLRKPIMWTGPATPPLGTLLGSGPTEAELQEYQRASDDACGEYTKEQIRKLPLLAREYGIDTRDDAWALALLLALASETVPGFGIDFGARRGPRKWKEGKRNELIADVEAVKVRRNRGDSEACYILVTSPRYKKRYGGNPRLSAEKRARALHNRLLEARKRRMSVAHFLANADGQLRQWLTAQAIELFASDPNDAASAKTQGDALWKSMTDELKKLEARAGAPERARPRRAKK
jgi:hypothetical protein